MGRILAFDPDPEVDSDQRQYPLRAACGPAPAAPEQVAAPDQQTFDQHHGQQDRQRQAICAKGALLQEVASEDEGAIPAKGAEESGEQDAGCRYSQDPGWEGGKDPNRRNQLAEDQKQLAVTAVGRGGAVIDTPGEAEPATAPGDEAADTVGAHRIADPVPSQAAKEGAQGGCRDGKLDIISAAGGGD